MPDIQLNVFENSVIDKFYFLEKSGFWRMPLKKIDFEYPQDRRVEVRYFSKSLCIIVRWYLVYANFEVGLIELVKGKFPEKYSFYGDEGYARGISLCDFIEFITEVEEKSPLKNTKLNNSIKKITDDWEERGKLINEKFDWLIAKYAEMLENYCKEILDGDFSIFPKVQNYSKSKL